MADYRFAWKRCACGELFLARAGERKCPTCEAETAKAESKPLRGQLSLFDSGSRR